MENFIIVLVSIGFVAYNIYKNFQKEMEKSKSRKPYVKTNPQPAFENRPQPQSTKKIQANTFETAYVQDIPEEVKAAQMRKKAHSEIIPSVEQSVQSEVHKNEIEFDLRQAVMQAAILERPYK